jgi:hypothetical protein
MNKLYTRNIITHQIQENTMSHGTTCDKHALGTLIRVGIGDSGSGDYGLLRRGTVNVNAVIIVSESIFSAGLCGILFIET